MSDKTDLEAKKMYFDAVQVTQYLIHLCHSAVTDSFNINQALMTKWNTT
jgi:hypothetical protein